MKPWLSIAAIVVFLLPSFALASSDLPPANTDSPQLGALELAFTADLIRDDPALGTELGLHAGDGRLPNLSAAGFARRIASSKRYLAALDALPAAQLSADDTVDTVVLRSTLGRELLDDETEQTWKHHPSSYTSAASYAIYDLFSRDFAPLVKRMRTALARERAIPALLADGEANITTVDATTAMLTKLNINGALPFFTTVVPQEFSAVNDPKLQSDFKVANDGVIVALKKFIDVMNQGPLAHPSGTFAIGADVYAQRLALQEGRAIPLDVYEAAGVRALAATKADFIATAKIIEPGKTPQEVFAKIQEDHPLTGDLILSAERILAELRAFVLAHHLVTLPAENNVLVRETPTFNRQTTFASMNSPGPFERVATQAYYYVTPVEPGWTDSQKAQHLAFFNNATFPIISAHEVMPGHYVNFVLHKTERLSPVRAIYNNSSYTEGWAHYCEQMMVDEGWGNGDPKVRLAELAAALEREARYLVGLRENTQGMSVKDGTRFFIDNAFMPEIAAQREALRGTQDPLYGYYTLGKLEILKLREDYKKKMGRAYSLQQFHDAFLAHGNPPIGAVRSLLLGAADDGKML